MDIQNLTIEKYYFDCVTNTLFMSPKFHKRAGQFWAEGMKLHCHETGELYTGAVEASCPEVVASNRTSVASSQKWEASCF